VEQIEVTLYPNQAEEIEKILEEFQVPYVKTAAESYKVACFHYVVTCPQEMAGTLVDMIAKKFDTTQRINVITHYKTESTISDYLHKFEAFLKEEIEPHDKPDISTVSAFKSVKDMIKTKKTGPIEGIVAKTDAFLSKKKDIYVMILVATVVALVGLVSNNVAVIIGAMLISPLLGPISSFALNSVLGRQNRIQESLVFGSAMVGSSIGIAAVITLALSAFYNIEITPEIQSRTEVSPVLIVVAVMLGIAGGLALLTSIPEIIVGVAIAVALVPPATTAGIGFGLGSADIAFGASLVLLSNIIGMVIGFMVIFLAKGISPRKYYEKQKAKKVLTVNIVVMVLLAVVLGVIEVLFGQPL
jgi:uncharacterized hydrophobic protein (TIGR00341 family)